MGTVRNYGATVTLSIDWFQAEHRDGANATVEEYIEHIIALLERDPGRLRFSDVDWVIDWEGQRS